MDKFLRVQSLPTWSQADEDNILWQADLSGGTWRSEVDWFLTAPTNRALARRTDGGWLGASSGYATIEEARKAAIADCEALGGKCLVVAENGRWVGPK